MRASIIEFSEGIGKIFDKTVLSAFGCVIRSIEAKKPVRERAVQSDNNRGKIHFDLEFLILLSLVREKIENKKIALLFFFFSFFLVYVCSECSFGF